MYAIRSYYDPIGPIEKGITYIVRPRMQPSNSRCSVPRISSGAIQLLVGPACSRRQVLRDARPHRSAVRESVRVLWVAPAGCPGSRPTRIADTRNTSLRSLAHEVASRSGCRITSYNVCYTKLLRRSRL